MKQKIFGILLVFCMLLTPSSVFAETNSFAAVAMNMDEYQVYIDIDGDLNQLWIEISTDEEYNDETYELTDNEINAIIKTLISKIQPEDENQPSSIATDFFNDMPTPGYVFSYYLNGEAGLVGSYDHSLFTIEELESSIIAEIIEAKEGGYDSPVENGDYIEDNPISEPLTPEDEYYTPGAIVEEEINEITDLLKVVEEELPGMLGMFITMMLTSCFMPIFIFIVFIKILKAAARNSKNTNIKSNSLDRNINTRREIPKSSDRRNDTVNRSRGESKRKRDPWSIDKNDDDPFSV